MSPQGRRRGRVAAVFAAVVASGAAARWWSGAQRAPVTHTVRIDAARYEPARLVVRAGDTVVWVNADLFPHTVTSRAGGFDSAVLGQGASWRLTPAAAGGFDYACTFHPTMTGRIEVE